MPLPPMLTPSSKCLPLASSYMLTQSLSKQPFQEYIPKFTDGKTEAGPSTNVKRQSCGLSLNPIPSASPAALSL